MSTEEWGRRAQDWAELAEPSNEPLYAAVLSRLELERGTRLLDLACGSGYAAALAADSGAQVWGVDLTPELLEIARARVPAGEFLLTDMASLPFADGSFDAVTAFNALQFADDPLVAAQAAARVLRSGGLFAAAGFAEPERNESTALHLALEPLRDAAPSGHVHAPYALSAPHGLGDLLAAAGLEVEHVGEVALSWSHPSRESAIRAVLASGGGAMAIQGGGEAAARQALDAALEPFVSGGGRVDMRNHFRYAVARR